MLVFIFFKDITYIKENIFNSNHIFDLETLLNYLIFDILLLAMCFYNIKVSNMKLIFSRRYYIYPKQETVLKLTSLKLRV